MKKLLVVLFAVMLVASIAVVSFGLDETVTGTVGLQLTGASNAPAKGFSGTPGDVGTGIVAKWALTKEFSDVYSAGITLKIEDPAKAANDGTTPVSLDGDSYIKANLDPMTITFYANNKNMNVAKDLVGDGLYDMASGAGVGVDYKVSDALVINSLVTSSNSTAWASGFVPVVYNYAVKGTYTSDALTLGAGLQQDGSYSTTDDGKTTTANGKNVMDINASMKLGDSLTLGAEYAGRTGFVTAAAELLKATFTADALTVNGKFLNKEKGFIDVKDADGDSMNVYDLFRGEADANDAGSALAIDATYKLSDTLSVNGALQDVLSATSANITGDNAMSLKVGLSDKLSDAVVVDAYYQIHNLGSKLDGKITDTLAEGLVASLEVASTTANQTGATAVTNYTAKIVATL